jgi:hypothetical protein
MQHEVMVRVGQSEGTVCWFGRQAASRIWRANAVRLTGGGGRGGRGVLFLSPDGLVVAGVVVAGPGTAYSELRGSMPSGIDVIGDRARWTRYLPRMDTTGRPGSFDPLRAEARVSRLETGAESRTRQVSTSHDPQGVALRLWVAGYSSLDATRKLVIKPPAVSRPRRNSCSSTPSPTSPIPV